MAHDKRLTYTHQSTRGERKVTTAEQYQRAREVWQQADLQCNQHAQGWADAYRRREDAMRELERIGIALAEEGEMA